jgi:hypothetical protein
MSGTISFNPYGTSQPQNTFLNPTQGYVQGLVFDDPTARLELVGGTLASTESIVMWGGRPLTEQINVTAAGASDGTGPVFASATGAGNTTGWSVFTQASSMVLVQGGAFPPVSATGNYVAAFRYGSNARIVVACDPALVTTITGGGNSILSQALYWDVTNYRITLTTTGGNYALPTTTKLLSTNSTNSKIITYSSVTAQASWVTGTAAVIQI